MQLILENSAGIHVSANMKRMTARTVQSLEECFDIQLWEYLSIEICLKWNSKRLIWSDFPAL